MQKYPSRVVLFISFLEVNHGSKESEQRRNKVHVLFLVRANPSAMRTAGPEPSTSIKPHEATVRNIFFILFYMSSLIASLIHNVFDTIGQVGAPMKRFGIFE